MWISRIGYLLLVGATCACSGGEPTDPEEEVEDEPEPPTMILETDCAAGSDPAVRVGEGVGSAFEEFQEGDFLPLEFASQAGMEAYVVVLTEDVDLSTVTEVSLSLLVDGSPIGDSWTDGYALRCDGETGRVETSLPIDVVGHPTVNSVAQLSEREAELMVVVLGQDEELLRTEVEVLLKP